MECDVKKQRDGPRFKFYARYQGITGRVHEIGKHEVFGGDPTADPANKGGKKNKRVSDQEIEELEREANEIEKEQEKPKKVAKKAMRKGKIKK